MHAIDGHDHLQIRHHLDQSFRSTLSRKDCSRLVAMAISAKSCALFITGHAENSILGNGHLAPGMAVLTKPFAVKNMAARIRSMIEAGTRVTHSPSMGS